MTASARWGWIVALVAGTGAALVLAFVLSFSSQGGGFYERHFVWLFWLNLAAAVQVLAYELRLSLLALGDQPAPTVAAPHELPANHAQMEGLFAQLGETLDDIDFHKGRAPDSAMRKLRRVFLRANLNEQEVRLLRGILADAQRMARLAGENGA